MRTKAIALSLTLVGWGCASYSSPTFDRMEADLRRMRSEQERQAAQLDQLRQRVVVTDDPAQASRRAAVNIARRATIRLGAEVTPDEPIRIDAASVHPDGDVEGPAASPDLPAVRISRNDRIPESEAFVVHANERLPVAPLPPATPGRPLQPSSPSVPSGPGPMPLGDAQHNGHAVAPSGTLDPAAATAYDAALAQARSGHCSDATAAFTRFLERWPAHPHADNALYWRAQCRLREGDATRAVADLRTLLETFPVGNKVPDALYALRGALARTGDGPGAERAGERLLAEHPDSEAARRLRDERRGR